MTFVASNITFGSYTFPAGMSVDTMQQPQQIDELKVPFLDGTSAPAGTRLSKAIRISGYIGGFGAVDSSGAYILSQDQAEAEIQLLQSILESGYQMLSIGATPTRSIIAQKKNAVFTAVEAANRRGWYCQIDFLAQDPRWISSAITVTPFGTGATATVTNAGNAVSYPKFMASGVFVNPTFKITPHGLSGYVQHTYAVTMITTDVLVVDCDPRNRSNAVLLNGVPRLDLLGTSGIVNTIGDAAFFPYLLGGTNTVVLGASSGSGAMSLTSQDAWL